LLIRLRVQSFDQPLSLSLNLRSLQITHQLQNSIKFINMVSKAIFSTVLITAVAASAYPDGIIQARQADCPAPPNIASVYSSFPPIPQDVKTALTSLPTGSTICANPFTDSTSADYASWTSAAVSYLLAGDNGAQVSSAIVFAAASCTMLAGNVAAFTFVADIVQSCGPNGATTPVSAAATATATGGGSTATATAGGAASTGAAAPAQTAAAAAGMFAAGLLGVLAL
jgi:hypothetical protein